MKTALITTTIRVPEVLRDYRKLDPEAFFFIAGDRKTPHRELEDFTRSLGHARYYSDSDQEKLGYESSEVIGWNKIMRRNIALLEAIKWGADVIVTVDDDNHPLDPDYFGTFRNILTRPFSGLCVSSKSGWFNAGEWLTPRVYHRGFPHPLRHQAPGLETKKVSGMRVGIAAGMWLGDPDIDAVERLALRPMVEGVSSELKAGVVLEHGCVGPFNTQNTAFVRALAPLMMVFVGVGRFDDIFASFVAQKLMSGEGFHVHYGQPMVRQDRNEQDLIRNLEDEIFGMRHTLRFWKDLSAFDPGAGSIPEKLGRLGNEFKKWDYLPPVMAEQTAAWCRDLGKIKFL